MRVVRPAWMTDVLESLRARPGRVGLACLSIAVGMASLSVLVAVSGGLSLKTRQLVAELGVNVFGILQPAAEGPAARPGRPLAQRHVDSLAAALPGAAVTGWQAYDSRETGLPDGTVLLAADERVGVVRPWRLIAGRFPDGADGRAQTRCAAISATLARELGLIPGAMLPLRGQPFAVIGVFDLEASGEAAPTEAVGYRPGERVVVVPGSVPPYWLGGEAAPKPGLDAVFVRAADPAHLRSALVRAENLLSQPDLQVTPVIWVTPERLARRWAKYQRTVAAVGGGVVALCLLMGGTTLMSLLLAGVRERVPEIGLRRSLGASRRDIGLLFMAEALCMTTVATVAGVSVALAGLAAAGGRLGLPWAWSGWCVAVPVLVGVVVAVAFSYVPARQAAGITPADALRSE